MESDWEGPHAGFEMEANDVLRHTLEESRGQHWTNLQTNRGLTVSLILINRITWMAFHLKTKSIFS